jgi:hypothetical protein
VGESDLEREVLRINERYLCEVVERFDLCPWAKSVRSTAKLHRAVYLSGPSAPEILAEISKDIELFASNSQAEIGLLLFPNHDVTPSAFRAFVGSLEKAHADNHPRHDIPLAMASFHPDAEADLSSPARLVSFIRRSPDPTIQLVRRDAMAKVREGPSGGSVFAESLDAFMPLMGQKAKLSVSESIAKNNLETIEGAGVAALEAIFQDIAEDRRRSYKIARDASDSP